MKIVMIINKDLPSGLMANTAAVLGISAGKMLQEIVGANVLDRDGNVHLGITSKVVPVLQCDKLQLKELRRKVFAQAYDEVTAIDFSEIAQRSLDYESYAKKIGNTAEEEIDYLGLCIAGPLKKISKLTGNLPLLR
ncbi:DUF2000 domain-containing protein [Azotosporobacter soli]|uniref:DUF2000 domain-containing protein n=1 Tax=Azotosporobacter soli TaxID=3055040 RepID=UPI0031FEC5D6